MSQTDARITINLPAEVYGPLKSACAALGVSMSAMVRDLVETSVPMLAVLEDAATTISVAPDKHRALIATLVDEFESVQSDTNDLMGKVVRLADPRASNTGVTP